MIVNVRVMLPSVTCSLLFLGSHQNGLELIMPGLFWRHSVKFVLQLLQLLLDAKCRSWQYSYIFASARLIDIIKLITQPTSKPNFQASVWTIPASVPIWKLHYSVWLFKFVPTPQVCGTVSFSLCCFLVCTDLISIPIHRDAVHKWEPNDKKIINKTGQERLDEYTYLPSLLSKHWS